METINEKNTLAEIVTNDFRAAKVFKDAGLDFCCGGSKTLGEACDEKNLDKKIILQELDLLKMQAENHSQNFNEWELGFLADYIVNSHHKYVIKALPDLLFYTQKIADVHGENHPELIEVAVLFRKVSAELQQHLKKEEEVLFPAIKRLSAGKLQEDILLAQSEILRMKGEHEFAGGAMDKINVMTGNYKVPDDGCNTYKVTFKLLEQFEDDLHVHVHLENNILYPKTLNL